MRADLIFPATPVYTFFTQKNPLSPIALKWRPAAHLWMPEANRVRGRTPPNKIALFNDRALAMAIRASGSKSASRLLQLVSGACNQQRNTKAP
jgi:hypothetical protein